MQFSVPWEAAGFEALNLHLVGKRSRPRTICGREQEDVHLRRGRARSRRAAGREEFIFAAAGGRENE
jgi:hypothetical protein